MVSGMYLFHVFRLNKDNYNDWNIKIRVLLSSQRHMKVYRERPQKVIR